MGTSLPDASAEPLLPPGAPGLGTLLADKYRLEGILGIGGMGVVYRSNHALLGVPVAIKIILPEFAARPEFVTRFTNEARAAARIQSDHIARVSDVGTTRDGISFLVMELLDGEDLGSILAREGPQPFERAVDWMLQATAGLADAHAAGIIHRDLKPSNLFLVRRKGKGDRIKICDFGISKGTFDEASNQLTKTNTMLGSPAYMAPEQLRSSRTVDGRADLWSLGIILYELLTGSTPFSGDNIGAVFAAILENDPLPIRALLPAIPEALDQAILRCLRRSPTERFASATELAAELAPFASDGGQRLFQRLSSRPEAGNHLATQRTTPHYDSGSHPLFHSPLSDSGAPVRSDQTPASGSPSMPGRIANYTQRLPSTTPTPASLPRPSHFGSPPSGPGPAIARTDPSREPPPSRRGLAVVLALGLLTVGGIATAIALRSTSATASPRPSPTTAITGSVTVSASESSTVVVTASPPDARLFFDDAPLPSNPFTITIARSGRHDHLVRAEAPNHAPATQLLQAESAPATITLRLERLERSEPSATASGTLAPAKSVSPPIRRPTGPTAATSAPTASTEPKPVPPTPAPPPPGTSSGPAIYTDPWKTN